MGASLPSDFSNLPPVLTEQQVADLIGVPLAKVRRWRHCKRIGPWMKIAGVARMRREAFIKWWTSREI